MEQPGDNIVIGGGILAGGLKSAIQKGTVTEARLNQMVARIFAPYYYLGQDKARYTMFIEECC